MAKAKNLVPIVSVKLNISHMGSRRRGEKAFYKTFSSAKGAARDYAYRLAHDFIWYLGVPDDPFPAGIIARSTDSSTKFQHLYDKAYRRSLKIFVAMGMK